MIRAFRSQWIRLRRRSVVLGWGGAMVGFALLATVLTLRRVGGEPAAGPGESQAFTVAGLSAPDGMATLLGVSATFLGVLTLGLFATLVANDYAQGTLRTLLVEQPRRLRLLTGELLALAAFASLFVVVASLAATTAGLALAPNQDVDTSAWLTADGFAALAAGIGNLILAGLGWGLLGTLLAVLFRSPAVAVAAGAAYALPGEALLVSAWDDGALWLPLTDHPRNPSRLGDLGHDRNRLVSSVAAAFCLDARYGSSPRRLKLPISSRDDTARWRSVAECMRRGVAPTSVAWTWRDRIHELFERDDAVHFEEAPREAVWYESPHSNAAAEHGNWSLGKATDAVHLILGVLTTWRDSPSQLGREWSETNRDLVTSIEERRI